MAPSRWSDEKILKFLDIYERYECLWNVRSVHYRNKNARGAAYEKMLDELDIPDFTLNDLKNKIRCLRTTYTQEKSKAEKKKSGQGTDEIYKPHLKWFDRADTFLHNIVVFRNSSSNMTSAQASLVVDEFTEKDETGLEDETECHEFETGNERPVKKFAQETNVTSKLLPPRVVTKPCTKRSNNIQAIEKAIDKLDNIATNNNKNNDEDEFDIFGKSVAIQLRQLPLERALHLEEQIQSLIRQERLRDVQPTRSFIHTNVPTPLSSYGSTDSITTNDSSYSMSSTPLPSYDYSTNGVMHTSDVLARALIGINYEKQ